MIEFELHHGASGSNVYSSIMPLLRRTIRFFHPLLATIIVAVTALVAGELPTLAASATNGSIPLRRPISPSQPMWLIHIDTWNYADPQKIIDLIPKDIRPFVVMNISLSISHDEATSRFQVAEYGYQIARSWLRVCAENQMWAIIQPSSGGFSQFSDFDLSVYEEFYREYPNLAGFNYCEQFWGYDSPTDPLSARWSDRINHFANLLRLSNKYGGYLVVSWCGNQWSPNINPIGMLKRNPAFAAACRNYTENYILCEKYTQQSYQSDMESLCLGAYLSGYAGQYGIRYDDTGWTDATGAHANFTMATAGAAHLEHVMLTGQTVIDGPELIWTQCFREISSGPTSNGYTMRRWETFPQFDNVSVDLFRKILDGTVRIPTRREVIDRTKVVVINNVNSGGSDTVYSSPETLFEGLYRMDGDGNLRNNKTFFKKTGRYPTIPTVYLLDDADANAFQVKVFRSNYAGRWPSIASKVNEFNALFPVEYTGDLYAGRHENGWVTYNPFKTGQSASASIPFKYNTCDRMELTYAQYSAGVIKEFSNSVSFYLCNYDNVLDTGLKTDTIKIYGATSEPTFSFVDRGNHQPSVVTKSWSAGVFTLTVEHNGPVDLTVNCAGNAIGRLTDYTPATIVPPAKPLPYAGVRQYEAECFDYRSIAGIVKGGYPAGVRNYTGQGYLQFGTGSSASVRDHVTVLKSGVYRLETRYAVTGATINSVDLYVNGSKVGTPSFAPTTTLSDWAVHTQNITLNAGTNTIEFRAVANSPSSLHFDNIVLVPSIHGDGVVVQEDSTGFGSVDGTIDTDHAGFTGSGFANTANVIGAGVEWNVHFDASAVKALTFRYAAASGRVADLIVNGTNVASSIQFPSTGTWTNWDFVTVYVKIPAGSSNVRLQSSSAEGLPNVDYVELIGGGAETTLPAPVVETIADAHVRDSIYSDANYGSDSTLEVIGSSAPGESRSTYLKFDVSALGDAQNVRLKLVPARVDGPVALTCDLVTNDDWTENGITWNTQPAGGTAFTSTSPIAVDEPLEIDLTAAVASEAAGDGVLTLRLKETTNEGTFVAFHSRDQAEDNLRPRLEFAWPAAPENVSTLIASAASSSEVDLAWTAVNRATRYNVKRSNSSGGPYDVIARNVDGVAFRDNSLSPGTPYYYVVTAVNHVGESDPGMEAVATTIPIPIFTMLPVADTYARNGGFANSSYGTADHLTVKTDNGATDATRVSYLKFDVHGLQNVQNAKLILTPSQVDGSSSLLFESWSNDNWTETGVTWNNQPGGTGSAISTLSSFTLWTPVVVDVTEAMKAQAALDGVLTIRVSKTGSDFRRIDFCSKEHATAAFRPMIEYVLPANSAPLLSAVSDRIIHAGVALSITNIATDSDSPGQSLTFSLVSAPATATINPDNGVILWRPHLTDANSTNAFTVRVTDSGMPSLSATQSFLVRVMELPKPAVATPVLANNQLVLQVGGVKGPDYRIEASTNLVDWMALFTTNSPAMPFSWTNSDAELPFQFFRVKAGPPF